MDIAAKLSIEINPVDATKLVKKAILEYLENTYKITADFNDVDVRFNATMAYGPLDRGPGSPEFSGINVTIKQAVGTKY